MTSINIQPATITQSIISIKIDVPFILLNERAVIRVLCFSDNMKLIHTYEFELAKPEYNSWLRDEDLINYVCDKYNFSLYNNNINQDNES